MFVIKQFFYSIGVILNFVLNVYIWLILIYAILSWFRISPYHPLMRLLIALVMPILRPIRRLLRPYFGPIDLSPMIAILFIWFLQLFLVPILLRAGQYP